MKTQAEKDQGSGADLTVRVENLDNGRTESFNAGPGTPVSTIIGRLYNSPKLGTGAQKPGDRLVCKGSGEDVFQFQSLHLRDYQQKANCADLVWSFSGPTGGA